MRSLKASQMIELQRKHAYYMRLEACNGPDYDHKECAEAITDYIDYYTEIFGEPKPILASTVSYLTARYWHQLREMGDTPVDIEASIEQDKIIRAPSELPAMPPRPSERKQREDDDDWTF